MRTSSMTGLKLSRGEAENATTHLRWWASCTIAESRVSIDGLGLLEQMFIENNLSDHEVEAVEEDHDVELSKQRNHH